MPVTASYSAATRKLSVLGDAASNSIIISRDVGGTLSVNAGAVAISYLIGLVAQSLWGITV